MNQKAAILIPTIVGREHYLNRLLAKLKEQLSYETRAMQEIPLTLPEGRDCVTTIFHGTYAMGTTKLPILIIVDRDNRERTIGEKRNALIDLAVLYGATHRAFIDDDDMVSDNYMELNAPGIIGNYDCNSLVGIYTVNGVKDPNKHVFIHSLKYDHWYEDNQFYYRNPNHLNFVSLEKTKDIKFQHKSEGEDGCWSEDLFRLDRLKTEYEITEPFYHYLFRTKAPGQI